jgi:hypothetical protein
MNAMQLVFYLLFALSLPTVHCSASTSFLQPQHDTCDVQAGARAAARRRRRKTGEIIPLNSSDYDFPVHEDVSTVAPELTAFFNRYTVCESASLLSNTVVFITECFFD